MNHCSSEGATVGIQSYLFKTKLSDEINFKTQNNFSSISNKLQNPFLILNQIQIQIKMTESNLLGVCDIWEHTIVKVFKQGLMFKQWIIFNKLENLNSILNYPIDDFTPSRNLCCMNEHGDILPYTQMKKYST